MSQAPAHPCFGRFRDSSYSVATYRCAPRRKAAGNNSAEGTPEIDRREMALAIRLRVKCRAQPARHLELLVQFGEGLLWQQPRQFRILEAVAPHRLGHPVVDAALE